MPAGSARGRASTPSGQPPRRRDHHPPRHPDHDRPEHAARPQCCRSTPRAAQRGQAGRAATAQATRSGSADLVERYPRKPGVPAIRALIEEAQRGLGVVRSELEERFQAFLLNAGLPRPADQRPESKALEVDCAWPAQRLIVELDGRATHDLATPSKPTAPATAAWKRPAGASSASPGASSTRRRTSSRPTCESLLGLAGVAQPDFAVRAPRTSASGPISATERQPASPSSGRSRRGSCVTTSRDARLAREREPVHVGPAEQHRRARRGRAP